MTEFPHPDVPERWTDTVDLTDLPHTDDVLLAVERPDIGAYIDVLDISPGEDREAYVVRAVPDRGEFDSYHIVTTVTDSAEAIEVLERMMSHTNLTLEGDIENPMVQVINEISGDYAPQNEDDPVGHPAEYLLTGHVLATGVAPEAVCMASGEIIHDSLVHTPRITCFATGTEIHGWAPLAFFHETTSISTVEEARETLPGTPIESLRDQAVLSGLAVAIRDDDRSTGGSDGQPEATIKRLEFHDVALIDLVEGG